MKRLLLTLLAVVVGLVVHATDYKLVTDVSQLEVGARYLVVAPYTPKGGTTSYYALGAKNGTNRDCVLVQESEGLISISDEPVKPITLATVEGDSDYPYA